MSSYAIKYPFFMLMFSEMGTYFQLGGLVGSVVNQGKPAPIDIRIEGADMDAAYADAFMIAEKVRALNSVSDVLVPPHLIYPGQELSINRAHAAPFGISPQLGIENIITVLTTDSVIAPSFRMDPKSSNNYMLTVQYPNNEIKTLTDFEQIPLRSANGKQTTPLESLASIKKINTPTEVDPYQPRRGFDVHIMPKTEELTRVSEDVERILHDFPASRHLTVHMGGSVDDMQQSFKSFGMGFILAVVLVYLILMAQFASSSNPFIILPAVPPGVAGVILFLLATGTTLNVMSLNGVPIRKAILKACSMRLRPILMTSLANVLGIIPMALALELGSEHYASLARAILGELMSFGIVTIFLVPAVYLLMHRNEAADEPFAEAAYA